MNHESQTVKPEVPHRLHGNGKPTAFVQLAVLIALTSDGLYELIQWLMGRNKQSQPPLPAPPPLSEWLPLYRQHRKIQNELFAAFNPSVEMSADDLRTLPRDLSEIAEEQFKDELKSASQEELETMASPFIRQALPNNKDTMQAYMNAFDNDDFMTDADLDKLLASSVGQFYFRAWLPCWILHQTTPGTLLRKARSGDDNALDHLLRLDKSIIHDPVIAERFHKAMHGRVQRERDLLLNALAGKPKGKLSKQSMKYGLSGMISQLAKESQTTITAPEITQLFDLITQVETGQLRDTHIPAGETFTRAISRNNKNWPMSHIP
ncbi:MAG: hypothetical protein JKX70_04610 [Phycisphaerales bacterium]|nr:hypothetical protein [Phycisphaerales bacterium]